ncbi:MAG: hypothetical protein LIO53_04370 [Oscillospiraceae bacterium]|nr:hypothetical protein [Oscillospiraceae bacterium]
MSNRDVIIDLTKDIPDSELSPVVAVLKSLYKYINNNNYVEDENPDTIDIEMITAAKTENDGTTVSLDEMLKKDGLTYADLQN